MHEAVLNDRSETLRMLVQAGANSTLRSNSGKTPLGLAVECGRRAYLPLLRAAVAEPQRSRLLFKARALLDAEHATHKARTGAQIKNEPPAAQLQASVAAAPVYLKGRVAADRALPAVTVNGENARVVACVKYALGLEGGGVVFQGQEPTVRMLPEVLVELLKMMVPKWDPALKGRPLGEGYIGLGWQEEGDEDEEDDEDVEHLYDDRLIVGHRRR